MRLAPCLAFLWCSLQQLPEISQSNELPAQTRYLAASAPLPNSSSCLPKLHTIESHWSSSPTGPCRYVMDVYMPRDKLNRSEHRGFGFVTFETEAALQRVRSQAPHQIK